MEYLDDIIVVLLLIAILGGAIFYIFRAKRRGEKCIGCPYAKQCKGNCNEQAKKQDQ